MLTITFKDQLLPPQPLKQRATENGENFQVFNVMITLQMQKIYQVCVLVFFVLLFLEKKLLLTLPLYMYQFLVIVTCTRGYELPMTFGI